MSVLSNGVTPPARLRRTLLGGLSLTLLTNLLLYVGHLIIARRLSRDEYATFTVVVSFVSLFALFADLGLTLLFVRKFAEADEQRKRGETERRGELLGSMLVLRIGLSFVVSGMIFFFAPLFGYPKATQELMYIMLLTLFISSRLMVVRSVGEAFLRGHNKYHLITLFASIDAALFAAALYFYGNGSLDLSSAVWIYSLCHIPGAILLIWFIATHARETGFQLSFHFKSLLGLVRQGLPLIFTTAFLTVHNYADALLLDKLSTPQEVSAFGAGLRVLSAMIFLPMVFAGVIGPRATRATVQGEVAQIHSVISRSLRVLIVMALLIAFAMTSAPQLVMDLLFGAGRYTDASSIVIVFGWAFVPITIGAFLSEIAVAEGRYWFSTIYTAILMTISVLGDIILIPSIGALGAALSKGLSVTAGSIVLLYYARQLTVVSFDKLDRFFIRCAVVVGCGLMVFWLAKYQLALSEIPVLLLVLTTFLLLVVSTKTIAIKEITLLTLKGRGSK